MPPLRLAPVLLLPAVAALLPAQKPTSRKPLAHQRPLIVTGFDTPESAVHDATDDVYLVSNIRGGPCEKDDNGFISRVSPDGKKVDLKWIDGESKDVTLHAPKGLAVARDVLWVADIDTVRRFDRATGKPLGDIEIKGASFLNDVSVSPDGRVWVSDTGLKPDFSDSGTDALWVIDNDKPRKFTSTTPVKKPNGIVATAGGCYVVTWESGELLRVERDKVECLGTCDKNRLDGLVVLADNDWLLSSWAASAVLRLKMTERKEKDRIARDESWEETIPSVEQPADIGFDRKRGVVLIPQFSANKLVIRPLE